jgi:hypothetical protein
MRSQEAQFVRRKPGKNECTTESSEKHESSILETTAPSLSLSSSLLNRFTWQKIRRGEENVFSPNIFFSTRVCLRERVENFSTHDPGNRIADRNARELDTAIAVALAERRRS